MGQGEEEIQLTEENIIVNTGGGAVDSVNGYTGDVVLTTSDLENTSNYQTGDDVANAVSTHNESNTAHSDIRQSISDEATNRENADTALQGQIDALTVSSDVVDVVGTYTDLQNYDTQHLKDNDIVKVLQDSTHNNAMSYYRWVHATLSWSYIGSEGPYYTKSEANNEFVPQTRTVNNKALNSDITLDASDVSAISTSDIEQSTGSSSTKVMSQDAITTALSNKQNTLTAGANISIDSNNEISATDTTYSDFTGTDGSSAGSAGLVPAPATTDAGKFLKADGTWDTAGGGGGGGDAVYSTKTTSNNSTGGAIYIGNKDSNQVVQLDPTTSDQHYKYFWALPTGGSNPNNTIPKNGTVDILGIVEPGNDYGVAIGFNAQLGLYTGGSVALGFQAKAKDNASKGIVIGENATVSGEHGIGIGGGHLAIGSSATDCVAIGYGASCYSSSSVALGKGAYPTRQGEVNVGCDNTTAFNNTIYRVIGGVHDGQEAHDAVTVGQVNATIDAINTALSTNIPHIGA